MQVSQAEIRKNADKCRAYAMLWSEYWRRVAEINSQIADGLLDVYTAIWPVRPDPMDFIPIMYVMPDGSARPSTGYPFAAEHQSALPR